MNDLIARLESASEGSKEMDAAIWEAVAPDAFRSAYWDQRASLPKGMDAAEVDAKARSRVRAPHYTTSLDAKLPGEEIVEVLRVSGGLWSAWAEAPDGTQCGITAATEPLARRGAALRARQHKSEAA